MRTTKLFSLLVVILMMTSSAGIFPVHAVIPINPLQQAGYHEAPMLASKVALGVLPPVEQRLPPQPELVVPQNGVIGEYGGTIRTASWWPQMGNVLMYLYEPPIRWNKDLTGYEPGFAMAYHWSADGKNVTFQFRPGVRWSDGVSFTTADLEFWWKNLANDPQSHSYVPAYLRDSDGTPITITFPDDYTMVWSADKPMWVEPYFLAQGYWEWLTYMMKPKHYLSQFHPAFTPGKTYEDLANADQFWANPDFPTLTAWVLQEVREDGLAVFVRNPYYWKVDTAGNQLPYVDYLVVEMQPDEATRVMNCVAGKYHAGFRICGTSKDIPALQSQADNGGYHLLSGVTNGAGAWPGYMVNQDYVEGGQNYPDDTPQHAAEIRELLRNKYFRIALSIGFDRKAVINAAWDGIGTPSNATISPQSMHFASAQGQAVYDQWASSFITKDVEAANAMLDELGMTKGLDGFRRLPSGKPFTLTIDISDWGGSYQVQIDAAYNIKAQWEANLAIKVQVNDLQGSPDLDTRTNEGYYMLRATHVSELDVLTFPDWIFPVVNRYYFPLEGRWYANGKDACVPSEPARQYAECGMKPEPGSPGAVLQSLYEQALNEPNAQNRNNLVLKAITDVHIAEGPFIIGVSGDQAMPVLISNRLKNVPDIGVIGPWAPATPGSQHPEQFWMDLDKVYVPMTRR